jgi:geranylgeranyl diphosphate synthase type II
MLLANEDGVSAAKTNSADAFTELLDRQLVAACTAPSENGSACLPVVRDHFAAGGSRVRARICFDAGLRLGLAEDEALLGASVCELLHNASLIHDDLLDRTAKRRSAPSVWARHGDTVAVCTGDLLISAAYRALADMASTRILATALRLVHQRTSEVIHGQAAECLRKREQQDTMCFYEQQAIGKSASLLSLALELPLLLSSHSDDLPTAHGVATHFAVAYQIADDLADYDQDAQEGSPNILLLLQRHDGLPLAQARRQAVEVAAQRLDSAQVQARLLPHDCAATLLYYAEGLRQSMTCSPNLSMTRQGA